MKRKVLVVCGTVASVMKTSCYKKMEKLSKALLHKVLTFVDTTNLQYMMLCRVQCSFKFLDTRLTRGAPMTKQNVKTVLCTYL